MIASRPLLPTTPDVARRGPMVGSWLRGRADSRIRRGHPLTCECCWRLHRARPSWPFPPRTVRPGHGQLRPSRDESARGPHGFRRRRTGVEARAGCCPLAPLGAGPGRRRSWRKDRSPSWATARTQRHRSGAASGTAAGCRGRTTRAAVRGGCRRSDRRRKNGGCLATEDAIPIDQAYVRGRVLLLALSPSAGGGRSAVPAWDHSRLEEHAGSSWSPRDHQPDHSPPAARCGWAACHRGGAPSQGGLRTDRRGRRRFPHRADRRRSRVAPTSTAPAMPG
jgi:hypothetical protein